MNPSTPCSDYVETSGIVYFARMLDKVRLQAAGRLPPGYCLGYSDPTFFDARFCHFWEVDYDRLVERTLAGGTNEEILEWCFAGRKKPNADQILIWNSFLLKRGWRDSGAESLRNDKAANGWADRADIQTFADLHDVDEGRKPRFS